MNRYCFVFCMAACLSFCELQTRDVQEIWLTFADSEGGVDTEGVMVEDRSSGLVPQGMHDMRLFADRLVFLKHGSGSKSPGSVYRVTFDAAGLAKPDARDFVRSKRDKLGKFSIQRDNGDQNAFRLVFEALPQSVKR